MDVHPLYRVLDAHALGYTLPDGHPGVQGGKGILRDHLQRTPKPTQLMFRGAGDVLAVKDDLASGDVVVAHNTVAHGRLAGAGLAHDAQGLPLLSAIVVTGAAWYMLVYRKKKN